MDHRDHREHRVGIADQPLLEQTLHARQGLGPEIVGRGVAGAVEAQHEVAVDDLQARDHAAGLAAQHALVADEHHVIRALVETEVLSEDAANHVEEELSDQLEQALQVVQTSPPGPDEGYEPNGPWSGYARICPVEEPDTSVSTEQLGHAFHVPRRTATAENAEHESVRTFMQEQVPAIVSRFRDDPEVRVVILRGTGEKAFISGADISRFSKDRY